MASVSRSRGSAPAQAPTEERVPLQTLPVKTIFDSSQQAAATTPPAHTSPSVPSQPKERIIVGFLRKLVRERTWSVVGGVVTLFAFPLAIYLGVLAHWTARNDVLQSCLAWHGSGGHSPDRDKLIHEGPTMPLVAELDVAPPTLGLSQERYRSNNYVEIAISYLDHGITIKIPYGPYKLTQALSAVIFLYWTICLIHFGLAKWRSRRKTL